MTKKSIVILLWPCHKALSCLSSARENCYPAAKDGGSCPENDDRGDSADGAVQEASRCAGLRVTVSPGQGREGPTLKLDGALGLLSGVSCHCGAAHIAAGVNEGVRSYLFLMETVYGRAESRGYS